MTQKRSKKSGKTTAQVGSVGLKHFSFQALGTPKEVIRIELPEKQSTRGMKIGMIQYSGGAPDFIISGGTKQKLVVTKFVDVVPSVSSQSLVERLGDLLITLFSNRGNVHLPTPVLHRLFKDLTNDLTSAAESGQLDERLTFWERNVDGFKKFMNNIASIQPAKGQKTIKIVDGDDLSKKITSCLGRPGEMS